MDLLKPKASTEQEFMLMLHDRIVELEKLVDEQRKEIEGLKKKHTPLCYDILKNDFTNGAGIVWDVRKPVEKSNIVFFSCGRKLSIDDNYLDAFVTIGDEGFDGGETISFNLPLFRESGGIHPIKFVLSDLTLRKLLTAIHEFYHSKATVELLPTECDFDDYHQKIRKNPSITWIDLMLSNDDNDLEERFKEVVFCGGDAERNTSSATIIHISIL